MTKRAIWVAAPILLCLAAGSTVGAAKDQAQGDADAGRAIVTSCASCHGAEGYSAQSGIAYIAGQFASYLKSALIAYRDGRRKDESMQKAAAELSDKAIADLAAYYASLPGFNTRPPETGATPGQDGDEDPFAAVKKLTAMCAGCHGDDGNSKNPSTPSLAGQHDAYLIEAIKDYQAEKRAEPMMQALTKPLEPGQIADIAYYYATRIPAAAAAPHKGDPLAGMAIASQCATCHGADGNSTNPKNPRLAGLSEEYLVGAIKAYRNGDRKNDLMRDKVVTLRDQDILDLAAYYASKEPQALPLRKPLTLKEWTARCDRCHGAGGNSVDARFPLLAGQDRDYLVKTIEEYHRGTREDELMNAMSFLLSKSDIEKLAAYYAQQRKPGSP